MGFGLPLRQRPIEGCDGVAAIRCRLRASRIEALEDMINPLRGLVFDLVALRSTVVEYGETVVDEFISEPSRHSTVFGKRRGKHSIETPEQLSRFEGRITGCRGCSDILEGILAVMEVDRVSIGRWLQHGMIFPYAGTCSFDQGSWQYTREGNVRVRSKVTD